MTKTTTMTRDDWVFRRTVVPSFMYYTGPRKGYILDNKDRGRSNAIHTPRELIEKRTNSYGFYGSARKDIPEAFSVELGTPPNTPGPVEHWGRNDDEKRR